MRSMTTPAVKSSTIDFKKSILETFATNEKANQLLLNNIEEAAWQAPPPSGKGRSIADIAAHIHHVRLMWLSAADKKCEGAGEIGSGQGYTRAGAIGFENQRGGDSGIDSEGSG